MVVMKTGMTSYWKKTSSSSQ
ncbi:Putative uncharacterized protein [Lactobacillus delbrueckii subsp. lactis]|nr:Putative uncharacterized protein [Lactobacillus delbrueckii subsp. lactis]